jgi:Flp pilus assembly protein TadG
MYKSMNLKNGCSVRGRRGSVLVEFALIALILYLIFAATIEFGRALMAAQLLQQAADIAAREVARTPGLPVVGTLTDWDNPSDTNAAFNNPVVLQTIFDPQYLVVDISNGLDYFNDKPILNRLLAPLMIPDYANGVLRYPGALVANSSGGHTVQIPVVTYSGGVEQIGAMLPVVEEILYWNPSNTTPPPDPNSYNPDYSPFGLVAASTSNVAASTSNVVPPQLRGTVALRINYPFQAASLSATAPSYNWPPDPNFNYIHPSDGTNTPGTYSGPNGLGDQLVFATNVRPYRRLLSAQAIYRREVLGP